jgi:hypothetical protein
MTIKVYTTWGRELTPEEATIMEARRNKLLSEGVVLHHPFIVAEGILVREWDTMELANGWVEFANSMNPPPVKVEVVVTE